MEQNLSQNRISLQSFLKWIASTCVLNTSSKPEIKWITSVPTRQPEGKVFKAGEN